MTWQLNNNNICTLKAINIAERNNEINGDINLAHKLENSKLLEMSILPKSFIGFKTILIELPEKVFIEINRIIITFI